MTPTREIPRRLVLSNAGLRSSGYLPPVLRRQCHRLGHRPQRLVRQSDDYRKYLRSFSLGGWVNTLGEFRLRCDCFHSRFSCFDKWVHANRQAFFFASVAILHAPVFTAGRRNFQIQRTIIGESIGFFLWFCVNDLLIGQHKKCPQMPRQLAVHFG